MKEQVKVSGSFRIVTVIMIVAGAGSFVFGLITDHKLAWANYLLVNYYFLSLAMGGAFFYVIQKISQSGWSSAFLRVPEAMMSYVPFAALFMLLFYFGVHDIYPWSDKEAVAIDPVMEHKSLFLNVPFFFVRMIIYFSLWVVFIWMMRKVSLKEDSLQPDDRGGIMKLFAKSELYSKIFIFISIITFSLAAIDWTMSIDRHWYSTIFAFKNLVGAFLHGVSVLILIVFILHKRGYFPFLNKYHLHDFARYLFMLSIVFGYLWFC
jgi:hypothetical protein